MANPRRSSSSEYTSTQNLSSSSYNYLINLWKRPLAFPVLLLFFVFLTWAFLRLQFSSYNNHQQQPQWSSTVSVDDDPKANLVRFTTHLPPTPIEKDNRGWLLDPISIARQSNLQDGAVSCSSLHLGEIRSGGLRGNHRHYTVNETFVIWGALTKFRLENSQVDKGYAEVVIGADEVAVAASPKGTAHALVNIDPVRTTFFIGCQDGVVNYNSSSSDFNVWKDL